ncbi:MAG TPA: hypothetical protein GX736_02320 [Mogibacterium sp.]|nr:hypothetical protein [Mogibacterium sp.]
MNRQTELKEYLHRIKILLPIYKKTEKKFISELSQSINDYLEDNPDTTMLEIEEQFGSPMEIAQSYMNSMDTDVLIKRLSVVRVLRQILAVVVVCSVTALFMFSALIYKAYIDAKETIITIEETIITDD